MVWINAITNSFRTLGRNQTQKAKWPLPIFLFLAPLIVALAQFSVLEFPTKDYTTLDSSGENVPYNPFPQVFFDPIRAGFLSAVVGTLTGFGLASRRYRGLPSKIRLLILVFSMAASAFLFWISLNIAQRAVISEYLTATDANGLAFLIFFTSPLNPIPFYGTFTFSIIIALGTLGAISMVLHYGVALHLKD